MGDNIHSPGHCSRLLRTFASPLLSLMLLLSSSSLTLWPLFQSLLLPSFQLLSCPCVLSQSFFMPCSLALTHVGLHHAAHWFWRSLLFWAPSPFPQCWFDILYPTPKLNTLMLFVRSSHFLPLFPFLSILKKNIIQASLWCEYLNQIWYSMKAHQPEI